MKTSFQISKSGARWLALPVMLLFALAAVSFVSNSNVAANHPVYVEGNCDSPVPGTTLVSPGTCGDYDGDGRIGTAEDTDGTDRIFGTLNAALGPGTGAAAGTGANHNGKIIIVASGRFAETLFIGLNVGGPGAPGVADPGNVVLEAAPGVEANLDAVLQGDPGGGNNTRQASPGIVINYAAGGTRLVTLRNLQIRNFAEGVFVTGGGPRVHIDNCRLDSNLNYGVHVDAGQVTITRTQIVGTGFRIGSASSTPAPGWGVLAENSTTKVSIIDSNVDHSFAGGIVARANATVRVDTSTVTYTGGGGIAAISGASIGLCRSATYFNSPDTSGTVSALTSATGCY